MEGGISKRLHLVSRLKWKVKTQLNLDISFSPCSSNRWDIIKSKKSGFDSKPWEWGTGCNRKRKVFGLLPLVPSPPVILEEAAKGQFNVMGPLYKVQL